jgi:predicted TIM-barrel fold metal-dependent hydrolase
MPLTRRALIAAPALAFAQTQKVVIDTHIHLFASDPKTFPFHKNATYRPEPEPLEKYKDFVAKSGLTGAVVVHPEPYQDDHSYLEYCFTNEPRKDFFKGTVLFDPLNPETPRRIDRLREKWPGRITALRVHRNAEPSKPPTTMGAIRDRDLMSDAMKNTVRALVERRMMLQVHAVPAYAPQISRLAEEATGSTVIVDHLCRSGQGSEEQWESIVRLHRRPNIVMKISGIPYSSKEAFPHLDVKPRIQQLYDAFGPGRLIWGGLGYDMAKYKASREQFAAFFDFTNESSRDLIRGLNAQRLYGWKA